MTPAKTERPFTIAVIAPGRPLAHDEADQVAQSAAALYAPDQVKLNFHPQCFLTHGHFAGDDKARSNAFLETANDPAIDAIWFARGGYGACRLNEDAFSQLTDAARRKRYLGYSDMGFILARLYALGFETLAHGPMVIDAARAAANSGDDGHSDSLLERALHYLIEGKADLPANLREEKRAAFNLTVLSHLIGAEWRPDFTDHILLVEDIGEYHYRIDRAFFTLAQNDSIRRAKGLMLGRFSDIPENDVAFGKEVEEIARDWCQRAGVRYLGRADIGHDTDNKVIPFGG